jgi:hypothetical protein
LIGDIGLMARALWLLYYDGEIDLMFILSMRNDGLMSIAESD